jgi:hypothetical protein
VAVRCPNTDRIDPNPFTIGLGIFGAVAGGGAFLEARRQRQFMERQRVDSFRTAWFNARRSLIHFRGNVAEFETYVLEEDFGLAAFRIGAVRLAVDRDRHQALRRLRGQAMTTANRIGDNLDDLSNYLGPEYQDDIDAILASLAELGIPESYAEVIRAGRTAIELYARLLADVGVRERFNTFD